MFLPSVLETLSREGAGLLLILICGFAASSGLSNGYWLRAQAAHDTEVAERAIGPKLVKIRPWSAHVWPNKSLQRTRQKRRAVERRRYTLSRGWRHNVLTSCFWWR